MTILFNHVIRCGGNVMRRVFEQQYARVLWIGKPYEVMRGDPHQNTKMLGSADVIIGHIKPTVPIKGIDFKVAFIRDPVQRIISLYDFINRLAGEGFDRYVAMGFERNMDILQFAKSGMMADLDNGITRMFAARSVPYGHMPMGKKVTKTQFGTAKRNFDKMDFVGDWGSFGQSLNRLAHILNWESWVVPNVNNVLYRWKPDYSEEIRELNKFDCELYERFIESRPFGF